MFGLPLGGLATWLLLLDPLQTLTYSDIERITGQVQRVNIVSKPKNGSFTDVWLLDQSMPIRYDHYHSLHALKVGQKVSIGIRPASRLTPSHDSNLDITYLPGYTLHLEGGHEILGLQAYNDHIEQMNRTLPFVIFTLYFLGIFMSSERFIEGLAKRRQHSRPSGLGS